MTMPSPSPIGINVLIIETRLELMLRQNFKVIGLALSMQGTVGCIYGLLKREFFTSR
jgi:hypothetical protein